MYDDLVKHLEGQMAYHRANCRVYMRNSAGIGEHNDIMASIKEELSKLAEAEDMLNALKKHLK
ncbi:hypothetical protein N9I79_01950 [Gammaproteobacteria bacterium]|jgi:hypothetical protein|nr:hypothetical protein [Gammaproteobacteria bacterium]MDB4343346.1 hypothetical protein [bacterium]